MIASPVNPLMIDLVRLSHMNLIWNESGNLKCSRELKLSSGFFASTSYQPGPLFSPNISYLMPFATLVLMRRLIGISYGSALAQNSSGKSLALLLNHSRKILVLPLGSNLMLAAKKWSMQPPLASFPSSTVTFCGRLETLGFSNQENHSTQPLIASTGPQSSSILEWIGSLNHKSSPEQSNGILHQNLCTSSTQTGLLKAIRVWQAVVGSSETIWEIGLSVLLEKFLGLRVFVQNCGPCGMDWNWPFMGITPLFILKWILILF
ncbi:hypothetical protein LIER_33653 [Lithospermum erythrorhizon]|uniref:Uncharacterized protein n=1 Tax=Lithospermum erythrorhizon TaxID=34254 RepID=A0AAV3S0R0_LITER